MMKSYVVTTGIVFALLVIAHIWRVFEEPHLAKDPWFIVFTLAAAAFCLWAWRVVRHMPRSV